MRLDLSNALKDPGQPYAFDCAIGLSEMIVLDDPIRFESVRAHGDAIGAGEMVTVAGVVDAIIHSRCARCLRDTSRSISANIKQVYARDPASAVDDVLPIDGTGVDLEPVATEALLLELPMRFLCREDCQGFCPVCGKDLNENNCTCQGGGKRNPFSALAGLLTKDEEV